jgi:hypothetical protein
VKIWASITRRSLLYKGTNKNSPVSLVKHKNTIINVTAEMIANLCCEGVVAIGETKFGIRQSEIRNKIHSLGSSDGHVPLWSTNLLDHANRKMVKHGDP